MAQIRQIKQYAANTNFNRSAALSNPKPKRQARRREVLFHCMLCNYNTPKSAYKQITFHQSNKIQK
jgi:hypothetical protein